MVLREKSIKNYKVLQGFYRGRLSGEGGFPRREIFGMIKKQEEGGGAGMTRKEEREWAWFDGQFRRHYSTMLRLTARQLRDPARAEELVQDAFELFWQKRAQLREHPNPGGWLMKTLQFLIRNEARSAGERLTQPLDGMALERAGAAGAAGGGAAAGLGGGGAGAFDLVLRGRAELRGDRRPAGDLRVPVPHAPDPRPAALPGAVGGAGRPRRIRGQNFLNKF